MSREVSRNPLMAIAPSLVPRTGSIPTIVQNWPNPAANVPTGPPFWIPPATISVPMAMTATSPSRSMAPYPTGRASLSWQSCFEVVPLPTREWKPEIAPHATITKSIGQRWSFERPKYLTLSAIIGIAPLSILAPRIIPIAPMPTAK